MACKAGKRSEGRYGDGNNVWHPDDMPAPLLSLSLDDIPGVGTRMQQRLARAGIDDDGGPARHAAETYAGAVGQRERRAAVVRAARL